MTAQLECRTHDWRYLREMVRTVELPRDERSVYHKVETYDLFYCSRCLKYNEVVTKSHKYVVGKYIPPVYKPQWDERLYIWWYNLTHRHSAKEAPR